MKLWIRSQNKEILKQVQEIDIIRSDNLYHLYDSYGARTIGIYKTKERALEILDEIQNLLNGNLLLIKNCDVDETKLGDAIKPSKYILMHYKKQPKIEYLHRDCVVYEMPEE